MKTALLLSLLAANLAATAAFADNLNAHTVDLKDGASVVIFDDGKMAMLDQYGRSARMDDGAMMTTKSGEQVAMNGNETARLAQLLHQQHPHK